VSFAMACVPIHRSAFARRWRRLAAALAACASVGPALAQTFDSSTLPSGTLPGGTVPGGTVGAPAPPAPVPAAAVPAPGVTAPVAGAAGAMQPPAPAVPAPGAVVPVSPVYGAAPAPAATAVAPGAAVPAGANVLGAGPAVMRRPVPAPVPPPAAPVPPQATGAPPPAALAVPPPPPPVPMPMARAPVTSGPPAQPAKGLPAGAPKLFVTGSVYSSNPQHRMAIVNGQVVREGGQIAPGLVLEQITPLDVVLDYRGSRYRVMF